uniref:Uncharacterized protein n=1 Tax=Megaselia scalaris TaxID=36166 RepID=T1GK68_MEGSC
MLDKLLEENEFITVFFYEQKQHESTAALEKLENIDSETDNLDITFVKMADARYARNGESQNFQLWYTLEEGSPAFTEATFSLRMKSWNGCERTDSDNPN